MRAHPEASEGSQRGPEQKHAATRPLALKRTRAQERAMFPRLCLVAFLKPAERSCVILGTERNRTRADKPDSNMRVAW